MNKVKLTLFISLFLFVNQTFSQQWYGFGAALDQLADESTGYFYAPIWQDSTVVNEFSDGMFPVWIYGAGQVLDPTSEIFEFLDDSNLEEDEPYMVDSLAFPYSYLRYQNENPDTLFIQFFKEENLSLIEQPWPDWEDNEDQSRARLDYDSTLLRSPVPFLEIIELLDSNDVTGLDAFWRSYPIEEFINPGEVIAATLTYKAGNPYLFGDTLSYGYESIPEIVNLRNQFVIRYYRDDQRIFYTNEFNHGYLATRASRYQDDSNGWDGQYWTGNATSNAFYHVNIQFHLSPMVGIEEYASSSLNIYPNPSNDILNFSFSNNQGSISNIEVLNSIGKVVRNYSDLGIIQQDYIDISTLPSGQYFLKIKTGDRIYSVPFVKL